MARRILIVKTTSMGDVIHALPSVTDIATVMPDAEIDWVVESSFADIVRLSTHVKTVHEVSVRRWRKSLFSGATWREVASVKKALQDAHYDLVIDLQGLVKSAVIGRWSRSTLAGYDAKSIKEPFASRFYDQTYAVSRADSAVSRCRQLCAKALSYEWECLPLDFGLKTHTFDDSQKPYVVFLVNTSRETKLWREERWVALAQDCVQKGFEVRFLWGSPAEEERVKRIAQLMGDGALVCPRMSIAQCAQVLGGAQYVIGVDTGLTHLAAALDRPTVGLFLDFPIELVGLTGKRVKSIGGVGADPSVEEVNVALSEVL